MATVSASLRNSPGQLWQFPVFFLGVAAVLGVWHLRPLWKLSPSERYQRDLIPLRQAIDKTPPDAVQVQTLLRKVQSAEPPAELLAQTQYLVGSAYLIMAETSANTEETTQYWGLARKYLEAAAESGSAESDRARLAFRLAKTWAMTETEPAKVIASLTKTPANGDDAAEANRVLAEMYLKLKPPELKKARDCLKEYLAKVIPARTEAQNRILNQARLRLGELCVELNDLDEARKVLDRIGGDSQMETLVAAKIQLAKSYQKELDWGQAIKVWEQAREIKDITAGQKATVLFQLADCYLQAGRRTEALATLEELRNHGGDEALASALKLAELQLHDSTQLDAAVQTLETALPKLSSPDQFRNPLLELNAARTIYEQAAEMYRVAGKYELSIRVARAYARIAEKGHDRELAAEALESWGLALLNPTMGNETDRARTVEEGIKKVREAAGEWHDLAGLVKTPAEQGDHLRRAANLYLKVGDLTEALKMLDDFFLQVVDYPLDRLAEVWLQKGEVYLKVDNREQAKICFQNGVQLGAQYPGMTLLHCRVRLAEMLIQSKDAKNIAKATADLEKALADPDVAGDKELHQQTLTLIADALFQQGEYAKAETRFRIVMDNYPDGVKAVYARFQLGFCYYQQARQEADRCKEAERLRSDPNTASVLKQEADAKYKQCYSRYMELLKKAAEPFKACEASLQEPGRKLSREEAILLRRSSFLAADCTYYLGEFDESLRRYDALAQRYSGTVVELEAYKQMYECQKFLRNAAKANDLFLQMRTVYANMHDSAFDGSSPVRTKEYWTQWFEANQGK